MTGFGMRGNTVYALSHRLASRYAVPAFDLGSGDAAHARVAIPQSARVIQRHGARRCSRRAASVPRCGRRTRHRHPQGRQRDLVLDGSHPALLDGYGAYGIVISPSFSPTQLAWLERGGVFDWHFGAHIATKGRTIDDFIGCAHYLIDHKYTVSAKLAGRGRAPAA